MLKGGWKIANADDASEYVKDLNIELSITGNKKDGYHLLIKPKGCSAADSHHKSLADAKENADDLFGIIESDWNTEVDVS